MNSQREVTILCPSVDWGIFFAIGAARYFIKNGIPASILTRSIAHENIVSSGIGVDVCDGSSIRGELMFMSPDPIAEMDARKRGISVSGCVADESDARWASVSNCWNGQNESSIIELYYGIFGSDMDMRIFDSIKGSKPYAGVAIKSDPVRMLVKSAFFADNTRLWHVPIRQNVSKRIQESCVCATLVTDDPFCAMSSYAHGNSVIFLRKPCDGIPHMYSGVRFTEQDISEKDN